MSAATQTIDIKVSVTFADDTTQDLAVCLSSELYMAEEHPILIRDTMARAARAINDRLKN